MDEEGFAKWNNNPKIIFPQCMALQMVLFGYNMKNQLKLDKHKENYLKL